MLLVSNSDERLADAGRYLEDKLTRLGLKDKDAADLVQDLNASTIHKWRNGTARPTIPRLGALVDALQPLARVHGVTVNAADLFIRFELIKEDHLLTSPVQALYRDLNELDQELLGQPEVREQMREHVRIILDAYRQKLTAGRGSDSKPSRKPSRRAAS